MAVALDWVGENMREGQPLPYTVKSQGDTAENKEIANNRELGATIKIIAVRLSWWRMQEGYAQGAGGYGIGPTITSVAV